MRLIPAKSLSRIGEMADTATEEQPERLTWGDSPRTIESAEARPSNLVGPASSPCLELGPNTKSPATVYGANRLLLRRKDYS